MDPLILDRATLELLQELAHAASKVEKLLNEVAQTQAQDKGAIDLDSRSRLLERVAGEVSRLSFHSSRGKDLDFVKNMGPRTLACRTELENHLATAFHQVSPSYLDARACLLSSHLTRPCPSSTI